MDRPARPRRHTATLTEAVLGQRVRLLEDEREILRTLYQYGHALDKGPEEDLLDAFVEEGVWERRRARRPGDVKRFAGREELKVFFRDPSRGRAPDVYFQHLLVEPRISLEGDTARVRSYFVRLQEHRDGPYVYAFGTYDDTLRRCPDRRWRIVRRLAVTEDSRARQSPPP